MMSRHIAFRFAVASTVGFFLAAAQRPLRPNVPLNEEPFVFSHNAATGYLEDAEDPLLDPTIGFSKNQGGSFTDQLNCGARALDLRPAAINGGIFFRHGDQEIPEISFQDGLQEILDWSSSDTSSPKELILLKIDDCQDGSGCDASVATILETFGVDYLVDCGEFATLTVGQAQTRGPVFALKGSCFVQNWDDSLTCRGFLPDNDPDNVAAVRACSAEFDFGGDNVVAAFLQVFSCLQGTLTEDKVNLFDCWADSDSTSYPTTRLFNYLNETAVAGPPQDGRPWQWQALWQVDDDSILLSIFRPLPLITVFQLQVASIESDSEESEVNRLVLEYVKELVNAGIPLNLVEVDYVCDTHGSQLLQALRPEGTLGSPVPTTAEPTISPSSMPTLTPSATPSTASPSASPSSEPSVSLMPSVSAAPSFAPSLSQAPSVSTMPSVSPSMSPAPSVAPSASPSTPLPSSLPSVTPSVSPSAGPTVTASGSPSMATTNPTAETPMPSIATDMPTMIEMTADPTSSGEFRCVPFMGMMTVLSGLAFAVAF